MAVEQKVNRNSKVTAVPGTNSETKGKDERTKLSYDSRKQNR